MTPQKSSKSSKVLAPQLRTQFGVRYGVDKRTVRLEGTTISGQWLAEPRIMLTGNPRSRNLLQQFANAQWSLECPSSLVPFIVDQGPLTCPFMAAEFFSENVVECFHAKQEFRSEWRRLGYGAAKKHWPPWDHVAEGRLSKREGQPLITGESVREPRRQAWAGFFDDSTRPRFVFDFESSPFEGFGSVPGVKGALRVGLRSLLDFLTLTLYATDARFLRRCWRPDCQAYFVAEDQKAHFHCHLCSQWGRSETKRQWHIKHGREWRDRRQAAKT